MQTIKSDSHADDLSQIIVSWNNLDERKRYFKLRTRSTQIISSFPVHFTARLHIYWFCHLAKIRAKRTKTIEEKLPTTALVPLKIAQCSSTRFQNHMRKSLGSFKKQINADRSHLNACHTHLSDASSWGLFLDPSQSPRFSISRVILDEPVINKVISKQWDTIHSQPLISCKCYDYDPTNHPPPPDPSRVKWNWSTCRKSGDESAKVKLQMSFW